MKTKTKNGKIDPVKVLGYVLIALIIFGMITVVVIFLDFQGDTKKVKAFCEEQGYMADLRSCYKIENSTILIERRVTEKDGRFYFTE